MIPAGRHGVGASDIAAWCTPPVTVRTLYLSGILTDLRFPAPISSPDASVRIWDEEQARAGLARIEAGDTEQGPDVVAPNTTVDAPAADMVLTGHPEDLLDRHEASRILGRPVQPKTWDEYVQRSDFLTERTVKVAGVRHHRRADILAWDASRPGRGRRRQGLERRGPDRSPRTQTRQRREREQLAQDLVAASKNRGEQPTGAVLARAFGVSERTGQRLLGGEEGRRRTQRRERARELLAEAEVHGGQLTGAELARKLAVSDTTGYRLLSELRGSVPARPARERCADPAARLEQARALKATVEGDGAAFTGTVIARELGVSERTGYRLLAEIRDEDRQTGQC